MQWRWPTISEINVDSRRTVMAVVMPWALFRILDARREMDVPSAWEALAGRFRRVVGHTAFGDLLAATPRAAIHSRLRVVGFVFRRAGIRTSLPATPESRTPSKRLGRGRRRTLQHFIKSETIRAIGLGGECSHLSCFSGAAWDSGRISYPGAQQNDEFALD